MSTIRQTEANRRNSAKSTGPTTDEGKNRSRENSFKHGLTGQGVVTLPEVDATVTARHAAWFPDAPEPDWFTVQVVLASLRIDRCQAEESTRRAELIELAADGGALWDRDRAREANALGATLAKRPELIQAELKSTAEGRAWMILQWQGLIDVMTTDGRGVWSVDQRSRAMDLLGITHELRPSRDLYAAFTYDVASKAIAQSQIELLKALDVENAKYDTKRRENAKRGFGLDDDVKLRKLRKYEAAALREFHRGMKALDTKIETQQVEPVEKQKEALPVVPARVAANVPVGPVAPAPASDPELNSRDVRAEQPHSTSSLSGNRRERKAHAARLRKLEKVEC